MFRFKSVSLHFDGKASSRADGIVEVLNRNRSGRN